MSVRILLLDQIKVLQNMGHEVVAVCADGPWVPAIRAAGVTVATVAMARELSPVKDLIALRALTRLFRGHHFDVVHTHTPKAGLLGPLAARLAGTPAIVHTVHGFMFHDRMPLWKQGLFWLPEKLTSVASHFLLSQSQEDVRVAVQRRICPPQKISYIGNGIDVTRFAPLAAGPRRDLRRLLGIQETDFVIGSVGRLVYEKGFAELFAAVEILAARHPRLKVVIVGPEEQAQNDAISPHKIRALQQRGTVQFTGWREDMPACYSLMDLFVLPSHREGIPRACMEAAAMARPIVATDIRGCREVVKHGETGWLVPVRNVNALVQAIELLMQDPARAQAMGQR